MNSKVAFVNCGSRSPLRILLSPIRARAHASCDIRVCSTAVPVKFVAPSVSCVVTTSVRARSSDSTSLPLRYSESFRATTALASAESLLVTDWPSTFFRSVSTEFFVLAPCTKEATATEVKRTNATTGTAACSDLRSESLRLSGMFMITTTRA